MPTAETSSTTFWIERCVRAGKAVMLAGPAGTGKTSLVKAALRNLTATRGAKYLTSEIKMHYHTRYATCLPSVSELAF